MLSGRYRPTEIEAFLSEVSSETLAREGPVTVRAHLLQFHNGYPRTRDLAVKLARLVPDFATPRSKLLAAKHTTGDSLEAVTKLVHEARELFVRNESGEGGEVLLYFLAECVLQAPQLLCKMRLKTNPNVHVHGTDGIHGTLGREGDLTLYWGESKIKKDAGEAIKDCMNGLSKYLSSRGGYSSPLERDLQLLEDNLDLGDPAVQSAVLALLDRSSVQFKKTKYCGLGLVGFDLDGYPNPDNESAVATLRQDAKRGLKAWCSKVQKEIGEGPDVAARIELFCVPFDSVEDFRREFARALGVSFLDPPSVDTSPNSDNTVPETKPRPGKAKKKAQKRPRN